MESFEYVSELAFSENERERENIPKRMIEKSQSEILIREQSDLKEEKRVENRERLEIVKRIRDWWREHKNKKEQRKREKEELKRRKEQRNAREREKQRERERRKQTIFVAIQPFAVGSYGKAVEHYTI